jgi:hypothetical protein
VREAWGDYDHDAFPDGVAATGGRYDLLQNIDPGDHTRQLSASISSNFSGVGTGSSQATRGFSWGDLDGDGRLDLVAFGNSLRVHTGDDRINDQPYVSLDCEPPVVLPNGSACGSDDQTTAAAFSGAFYPATGGNPATIIASSFPTRALYRITPHQNPIGADIAPLALPNTTCIGCTLQAVVVRDLDGDHVPDVVVIDSSLQLYVQLSKKGAAYVEETPIVPATTGFTSVRVSVSGAVR